MNDRDQPLTPNDRLAQPESTPVSTPDQFPVLRRIGTRWGDNDVYGHLNNVVYYSLFDSVVNQWLIDACATDIRQLPAIGVIAETSCKFLHSTSFPDMLWIGLALGRRGTSSAVYHLAVFRDGDDGPESLACAVGRFVHVYVDRDTRQHRRLAGDRRGRRGPRGRHPARRGYGNALMGGIAAARGEYVIMGDADDSYDSATSAGSSGTPRAAPTW